MLACLALGVLQALPSAAASGRGVVIANSNHYFPGDTREVGDDGSVPLLTVLAGSTLTLVNLEANFESHSVTAVEVFPGTETPLFDSDLVSARQSRDVAGVAQLGPGRYQFRCRVPYHDMVGYLNIVELPGGEK